MPINEERARKYRAAIQAGTGWIADHQASDGSHEGVTDIMGYYTCPLAYQAAGRPMEALRCLEYVKEHDITAAMSWHHAETIPKFEDQTPAANCDICTQKWTWIGKALEIL